MQPICGMDIPELAPNNVLLDYVSTDPITTIINATKLKHYCVALAAFLALASQAGPIAGGRLFSFAQRPGRDSSVEWIAFVEPANFYTLIGLLFVCCIVFPLIRPPAQCGTARQIVTLVDVISLCYDSHVLKCDEFWVQDPTDGKEHLKAKVLLRKRRYQYGLYRGLCGRRHLGFDVAEFIADDGSNVEPVDHIKIRHGYLRFMNWWFRKRKIVPALHRFDGIIRADTECPAEGEQPYYMSGGRGSRQQGEIGTDGRTSSELTPDPHGADTSTSVETAVDDDVSRRCRETLIADSIAGL